LSSAALLLGVAVVASAAPALVAPRSDTEIREVAKASLAGYLEQIPAGQEPRFGFGDRQELLRAGIGVPVAVLGIRSSVADSAPAQNDSAWNRVVAQDRWRVPVTVNGRPKAFVTVEVVDGALQAVDFGGADLAREIDEFEATHTVKRRALLRLDALRCDMLVVDRTGAGFDAGEYHPLRSAKLVFGSDTASSRSRKDAFEAIHRQVRQKMSVRR